MATPLSQESPPERTLRSRAQLSRGSAGEVPRVSVVSDKDKISFSELDRRQRQKKGDGNARRPRSQKAQRRARAASARYRQKIDEKLFGKKEDAPRLRMEQRLREAHGSPLFGRTFREYVKGYGMPGDIALLVTLLDLDEETALLRVLETLGEALEGAPPEQRSLLRMRLRNLEMSTSSDALADAAGDLLARM